MLLLAFLSGLDILRTLNGIASFLGLVGVAWMHSLTFERGHHRLTVLQAIIHYLWIISLTAFVVTNFAIVLGIDSVSTLFRWVFWPVVMMPAARWWLDIKINEEILAEKREKIESNGD